MRKMMLALGATAMVVPSVMVTTTDADPQRRYKYREWKGNDTRIRCRKHEQPSLPLIRYPDCRTRKGRGPADRARFAMRRS